MRVCICLEYKGSNYLGWQKNGENKTLCHEIEKAFESVLGEYVKIVASGRTDAGVHALKQVAHFDMPKNSNLSLKNLLSLVNEQLPIDIKVTAIKEVSDKFHARYNVKSKTYLYKCYTSLVKSPLREGYYCHYPAVLNVEKLKECAQLFVGKHNFKAFCLGGGDNEPFEREVISIDVIRKKDELLFYVKGKGFLYGMVRLLVGTMLFVGQNKISIEDVKNALTTHNKDKVGDKMPACGLYLYDVEY